MKKPIRFTYSNGLRCILVPQKDSLTVTVAVVVAAGSKYETKEINGLSHFLEHMCFKGTKKRPRPIDIAGELDGMGAQYNASTGHEYTTYYAKVRNNSFKKALDVVSDLYLNPVFNKEDIEIERGVIIEEINMYEDAPPRKVEELFYELVYGDQPAGWSIAGTKENIKKLTREDFIAYRGKNYLPESTVVFVAGNFDPTVARKEIGKYFSNLSRGTKMKKPRVKELQTKPKELIYKKDVEQTHLVLGVRAFDVKDKRRFALEVLSEVLGGGMSSRLFKKVRDELGAAYYVRSGTDLFSDHGFLSVAAGVDNTKVSIVISAILDEMRSLKNNLVSEAELEKAKEHLVGGVFLNADTSDSIGYFYGMQEIMDMPLSSPEDVAKKIKAVTPKQVRDVARLLFKNEGLNLALVGPFKNESFLGILKI
ncbi:MAG: pitrilysin family protein [Patescibacteria group bacterium]